MTTSNEPNSELMPGSGARWDVFDAIQANPRVILDRA